MSLSPGALRVLRGALVGLAAGGAGAAAILLARSGKLPLLERAELVAYDASAGAAADPARASRDIVLLVIDQESLDEVQSTMRRGWPWPRDFYAALVAYLRHAGARAIGIDLLFSEESVFGEEDDAALAEGIAGSPPVFVALAGRASGEGKRLPASLAVPLDAAAPFAPARFESGNAPVEAVAAAAAGAGSVVAATDADGVIRRASVGFSSGDEGLFFASFPLRMAMALRGESAASVGPGPRLAIGGRSIPLAADGSFWLRYPGGLDSYPRFRMSEVLGRAFLLARGESVDDFGGRFRDKIVLVGATAAGLQDVKATPFGENTPGILTVATALDNILSGDAVARAPAGLSAAAALAAALAVSVAVLAIPSVLAAVAAALAILAAFAFASFLALSRAALWIDSAGVLAAGAAAFAAAYVVSYVTEGRQRKFLVQAFSRYLHPEFVRELVRDPRKLRLGGERREITILFSDLAGFTSLSEGTPPEELVSLLNDYLTRMTAFVLQGMGTVDKFIGDAIMAFWGAPLDDADHAMRACRSAVRQAKALDLWRAELRARGGPELAARFGLATGPAVVGNLGSKDRFDYTAIGDTVNLASRLEGANKSYGTTILLADATRRAAGDGIVAREVDLLRVKGKKEPIRVHELLDLAEAAAEPARRLARDFEAALALYRAREFAAAGAAFEAILASRPGDGPSALYLERSRALLAAPPPAGWDGVFTLTTK